MDTSTLRKKRDTTQNHNRLLCLRSSGQVF